MNLRKIIAVTAMAATLPAMALRFGNEATDTTEINRLLTEVLAEGITDPSARTAYVAQKFLGIPYQGHTLEGETEELTVRLDSLDCTTFVETAMALSYTAAERRSSWRDFVYNLERLRYRNGHIDGYPSRLHYISDWATDNIHRGNFDEVTNRIPFCDHVVRTIDYMSSHRSSYPALADSANFAAIKNVEAGYRSHRFPCIKAMALGRREVWDALRSGDVVALVTKMTDLDVVHMGIIIKDDAGVPHLLHASLGDKKVTLTKGSLAEYFNRNPKMLGLRVFRLKE
ncbi:MAG: DUF1460 domain-containing protein [Muribaculaceae bacterium]|nr:DUF1460 domain-containing protein [Muribaculaceae bacterium]